MKKIELRAAGEGDPVIVEIEGDAPAGDERVVSIDGASSTVGFHDAGDGTGWLREPSGEAGGRVIPFAAVRRERSIDVWIDGGVHHFELAQRTPRRAAADQATAAPRDLTAPMPGTILRINVTPGSDFEAHEPLVVMESMKMEMALSAPFAGRVTDVLGAEGDLVEMGATLARLEARPAAEKAAAADAGAESRDAG